MLQAILKLHSVGCMHCNHPRWTAPLNCALPPKPRQDSGYLHRLVGTPGQLKRDVAPSSLVGHPPVRLLDGGAGWAARAG